MSVNEQLLHAQAFTELIAVHDSFQNHYCTVTVRAIPPGPDWLYSVHMLYTYLAIGHCGTHMCVCVCVCVCVCIDRVKSKCISTSV